MGLALDFLTHIVNVHWGVIDQQGLVASYPLTADGSLGEPTASAVDSGDTFSGVAMGASGLGHTVLTKGLVCFGAPRDGPSCFMAAPDYDIATSLMDSLILKRGTLDEEGKLKWTSAGGGAGLVALTFAGEAFHAVYLEGEGTGATRIETSFDGKTWKPAQGFPEGMSGGAVAFNGNSYTAVGEVITDTAEDSDPVYVENYSNLAWATASASAGTSLSWSSGSIEEIDKNPGADTGATLIDFNGACTVAGGRIGEGESAESIFVAATYDKEKVTRQISSGDDPQFRNVILQTAAAARSMDGSSWANTVLPGVTAGFFEISFEEDVGSEFGHSMSTAVVYVRKKEANGYFLCAANSYTVMQTSVNDPGTVTIYSTLHKSEDGMGWSEIKREDGVFFFTLSAIAKDLSKTRIVHL